MPAVLGQQLVTEAVDQHHDVRRGRGQHQGGLVEPDGDAEGGGGQPTPSEAVLTVGWGGINRIDLEPAACADPDCDADHGYTGMVVSDDFSLRVSSAADGQAAVDDLLVFAESLSARQQS